MKKSILAAAAVAAFSLGGLAQADVIDGVGNTISRIFGVPYDPRPPAAAPGGQFYTDAYGRRIHIDAAGRHVPLDRYGSYRDQWGRTVYLGANNQPAYIEQDGRLIPYGSVAMGGARDNDRDGVPNRWDRAPNDPRWR